MIYPSFCINCMIYCKDMLTLHAMVMKRKRGVLEIPQIDGGWQGSSSLPLVEMMRGQRFTMDEIAVAFKMPVRTLYYRINKAKAADSRTSDGPISPLPDTDKHAPSDEGSSLPRRTA